MKVTLLVIAGPHTGRKVVVRDGEVARFGRTEWADYSFADDTGMADVHFSIQCTSRQCVLNDLRSGGGTWVAGRSIASVNLATGDVITAGQGKFLIALGEDPLPRQIAGQDAPGLAAMAENPPSRVLPLAYQAKLSSPALALAEHDQTAAAFVAQLRDQQRWPDALAFLAIALPKPVAVAWSSQCLRLLATDLNRPWEAADSRALELAERWAKEPGDDLAREAEQAATRLDRNTGPSWCAMAAYFGGSSLAPANVEAVPPPFEAVALAIKAAFSIGLTGVPKAPAEKLRAEFCRLGEALLPKG